MFTEETANLIQLSTYPLALIGVVLLALEVWRNDISRRIEGFLDDLGPALATKAKASFGLTTDRGRDYLHELYRDTLTRPGDPLGQAAGTARSVRRIFGYIGIYLEWVVCFLTALPAIVIRLLNNLTGGHALGGIGIVLEMICFAGDTYQVAAVLGAG